MKALYMDNRFKRGLVLGGIIGSIIAFFASSEKTKPWRHKFGKELDQIYDELRIRAMELSAITRENYENLVDRIVNEYSERKNIAGEVRDRIGSELKNRFDELQLMYLYAKIKSRFMVAKKTKKEEFEEIVNDMVDEYAEKKEIALTRVRQIKREFKDRWNDFKKELERTE